MLLCLFVLVRGNNFGTLVVKARFKHKHVSPCVALYFARFIISSFINGMRWLGKFETKLEIGVVLYKYWFAFGFRRYKTRYIEMKVSRVLMTSTILVFYFSSLVN